MELKTKAVLINWQAVRYGDPRRFVDGDLIKGLEIRNPPIKRPKIIPFQRYNEIV